MSEGIKKINFFSKFDASLTFVNSDVQGNLCWIWKSGDGVFRITRLELSKSNPYTQNKFFSIRRMIYPDGNTGELPIYSKKVEIVADGVVTSVVRK